MTDRYWVANGKVADSNVAGNWNTAADGTGSSGVPANGDSLFFAHANTLDANIGYASCRLTGGGMNAPNKITTTAAYRNITFQPNEAIVFTATGSVINLDGLNPADLGFRVGMTITVAGATEPANNGDHVITTLNTNEMICSASTFTNESTPNATITYIGGIDLNGQNMVFQGTGQLFVLDCSVRQSAGGFADIKFDGGSTHATGAGRKYLTLGDNAVFEHLANTEIKFHNPIINTVFDDGIYPLVRIVSTTGGYASTDYVAPTSQKHGKVSWGSLRIQGNIEWRVTGDIRDNLKKIFEIRSNTNYRIDSDVFDTGYATFVFDCATGGFILPTTGDSDTFGTTPNVFTARLYNVVIKNTTSATNEATIPTRRTLRVNSITVETGAQLIGNRTKRDDSNIDEGVSSIVSTTRPTIKGAWNFMQIADGIYSSILDQTPVTTPSHGKMFNLQFSFGGGAFKSHSDFHLGSAFDAATGILKAANGSYMSSGFYHWNQTYAAASGSGVNNTIWVTNTSPSVLYYTDSAGTHHNLLAGGGGGSSADEKVKISSADPTTDYLGFKIVSGTNTGTVVNVDPVSGNQTLGINATDAKVAASASDGTPSNLADKLLAGSNITLTTTNDPVLGDQITIASTGGGGGVAGITYRDEGVALTSITSVGSVDFVGAGVTATSPSAGTVVVTIPGGGGGGSGGYPLFKHDENPATNGFSPFRLLANGDTIEVGVSAGATDNKDVSVFTPAQGEELSTTVVTATHIGSVASNTGREYIFYGQSERGGVTRYKAQTSSPPPGGGFPQPLFVFIDSMRELNSPFPPINDTLAIIAGGGINNVRVVDAGEHSFSFEDESLTIRALLVTGFNYCGDLSVSRQFCNYTLERS